MCTHGNEDEGLDAVVLLKKTKIGPHFDFLIGNPRALEKKVRFVTKDLNRTYPGIKCSEVYEESLAWINLDIAKGYETVVDVHLAPETEHEFVIIPKLVDKIPSFVRSFDLNEIVIWPSNANTGSMPQFLDNAVGLEFGRGKRTRQDIVIRIKKVLANLLRRLIDGEEPKTANGQNPQSIYSVYGKLLGTLTEPAEVTEDFKEVKVAGETFLPLLTNLYLPVGGIKCYKMRDVTKHFST